MERAKLKYGSVFSGIEGIGAGFEATGGFECAWQCEIDKQCSGVLRRHWPNTRRCSDATSLGRAIPLTSDNEELFQNPRALDSRIDILVGGFPCQDLSTLGARAGIVAGERSSLFFEFARVLGQIRPRYFLLENVPGLLSSHRGRDFKLLLDALADLGYTICWRVLDARHFGIPQSRRRVYVAGSLRDDRATGILFEPNEVPRNPKTLDAKRSHAPRDYDGGANERAPARRYVTFNGGMGGSQTPRIDTVSGCVTGERKAVFPVRERAITMLGKSNHADAFDLENYAVYRGEDGAWTDPRHFTPLEVERIMGFPDHWTAGQPNTTRYRQLGNAVCPPVAKWIGEGLLDVHTW